MNRSRCRNCGFPRLEFVKDGWKCPACDAFYKEETLPAEVAILLSNAYQQLNIQEFQAAEEMFEDIINKYPKSSDAYWGYVCARYGIKYEEDFDGKKIPTCCFPTIESFAKDKSYKKAIDYADNETANWYINQAEYIDRVRETWVNYVSKEPAYDIFICYKDSDEQNGIERTDDSKEAAELYWHLKEKGYSVFYSRESLRDKLGEKYEPYIFGAINTAKVMILYCSKIEYVESTWVKNEWRRYYKKIDSGEKKSNSLIVAYKGFQPSALPGILSSSQCIYNQSKNFFYDIDAKLEQLFNEYKRDKSGFDKRTLTTVSPLHRHKYTDKVIAATCISKGYTEHRCSCGESYRDNWTPLVDHDYVFEKRIDPECEKEGSDIYVCSICGEKRLDTIPAKGHSFGEWIEKKRPSCTDEGIETRQCTVCGSIEERSIPHLSHEWQDPTLVTKNDGQQNYISVCRLCGAEKIISQPALEEYNRTIIERKRLEKARKRKKAIRISLLIIAVLAVLSYIGIRFVRSESEIKYNFTDNGTYSFDVGMFYKYPESFTVPSTYNRKAVTRIADNAFCDEKEIKEIYIPSSITELGTNVFANTSNDLLIKLETVQKDGYDFLGWEFNNQLITQSDGVVIDNYSLNCGGSLAPCFAAQENTILFNGNGADNAIVITQTILTDDTSKLLKNGFFKAGYVFSGWSTTADGNAVYSDEFEFQMAPNGSVELFAVWKPAINELIFDGNGAKSGIMDSMTLEVNSSVSLPINRFTRDGYQFAGWSLEKDGKIIYSDGAEFIMKNDATVVLYAVWEKGAYSITYDLDGGVESENRHSYDVDTPTFILNTPVKEGYTFIGWTGTELSSATNKVTINIGSTGDRTYTAHWEANTNTLKFDANGGTGTMSSVKAKTSETVKLPSCSFTRNGYQFIGWSTRSDGKVAYNDKGKYTVGTKNVTLYAIWEKGAYSITYNLDGGTVSGNKNTYDVDTATFALTAPTKAGYTFTGWTGTGLSAVTKTVTINKGSTGDRTYTAHWEANTNTLKFDANGGTGTMADVTIKTDAVSTLPANKLTKSGYTFAGWSITKGGAVVYSDKSSYKMGTSATNVLYAVWKIETYSISYNLNGGTETTNRKEYNVETATFNLAPPAREGYTFTGWIGTGLSAVTKNVSVVRGSTGNRSYKANWNKNTYSISYTLNGGNDPNNAASYDIETNSFTLFNPTKTGYVFAGWTGTGLSAVTKNVTINKGSVGNRQYSANWEIENYTIHYDLDGGTVSNAVNSYNITTSSFSLPVPQKSGYTFVGWSGSNISGIVENVTVEKGSTGNLGFVANWSANTNVLTLTDGVITKQISAKTDSLLRLPKNEFSKDDVLFAGWSTSNNGEVLYYDQDLYKMGTASHYTLYAIFKEDTYEYVTDRTGWIAISTPQDLFSIADDLSGKYYLTNDIDMYGYEWTPIGEVFKYKMAAWYVYRKTDNAFRGILDGNGHAIYNLHSVGKVVYKEDVDYGDSTHNYRIIYGAGLFGYMENGKVINLQIINAKIEYNLHQNQLYYYDPDHLRGGAITANWADFQFGIISAYDGVFHNCYVQGDLIFSSSPLPTDLSKYIRDVKFGGIAGMIGCDFPNCSADIRIISQREGQIGELRPSSELVALSYESETYNAFDRGYIWYALGNGTYRYQNAKYHSLVKALDCIETKDGYTFSGWAISKDGIVKYRVGDECYIPYEDDHLILYPVWKAD